MIPPADMLLFTAVVREGSFERAARALSITPSALSQRVKLLEERLGAVLIVRGKPPRATAVGARLCRHAEQVALLERELALGLPDAAAPTRLRLVLWSLHEGLDEFPESPPPGLVTVPNIEGVPKGYYTLSGYHPAGVTDPDWVARWAAAYTSLPQGDIPLLDTSDPEIPARFAA